MISQKMVDRKSIIDSIVAGLPLEGIMVLDASLDPIYQDKNAARVISQWNGSKKPGQAFSASLPEEVYRRCRRILASAERRQSSEPFQHRFDLLHPDGEQKVSIYVRLITKPPNRPLLFLCINPQENPQNLFERLRNHGLTKRETEVVSLLSEGLTNRCIGERLFISEYTVENHLRSIYRKMHVTNRTAVVCGLLRTTVRNNGWLNDLFISDPVH